MRGDHQPRHRSGWAIVEGARHPAFRMGAHVAWSTQTSRLHDIQIEEMIGPTSGDDPQISREDIEEGSRVAIQAVQTQEHRGWESPSVAA